jgi:hypothetical protein
MCSEQGYSLLGVAMLEPAHFFRVEDLEMKVVLVGLDQTEQPYIPGDCTLVIIISDFI